MIKILKDNILLTYTVISVLSIIVLPIYVILFLPAKFTELIVENTKNESVRVANHMVSMFLQNETDLSKGEIRAVLIEKDEKIREEFQLAKLKLFLPNGEIVYSTNTGDIGEINTRDYFFDVVAKGIIYPQLVTKDTQTLEGQKLKIDVVETYVPVMKNGVFVGAFEIYSDITDIKKKLDALMIHIYAAMFIISGFLLFVIIISSIKAKHSLDERNEYEKKLHDLSITDELTGLLNRRGFISIAEKQINIVDRSEEILFLFYADIDNMKAINDNFGHNIGDISLKETADLLRVTFRKSDVLSRLGGDEFAVLLTSAPEENSETEIVKRFNENLEKINQQPDRKYDLQISYGLAQYTPEKPCNINELMTRADKLMYERKMRRKSLTK